MNKNMENLNFKENTYRKNNNKIEYIIRVSKKGLVIIL